MYMYNKYFLIHNWKKIPLIIQFFMATVENHHLTFHNRDKREFQVEQRRFQVTFTEITKTPRRYRNRLHWRMVNPSPWWTWTCPILSFYLKWDGQFRLSTTLSIDIKGFRKLKRIFNSARVFSKPLKVRETQTSSDSHGCAWEGTLTIQSPCLCFSFRLFLGKLQLLRRAFLEKNSFYFPVSLLVKI